MTSDYDDPTRMSALDSDSGTTSDADADERVEQLTAEIDETRGDLTETIQAIGEKLEPANVAKEATETVKASTLGKVEQMSYGAQETWRDMRTGNAGSIVDTVKSNPVPAGMVGIGLAMLLMNRGKQAQGGQGRAFQDRGGYRSFDYGSSMPGNGGYGRQGSSWDQREWDRNAGSGGSNPLQQAGSTVAGAAGSAGETVGRVADQAGQRVGELAGTVGQTAGEIPQQAGYYVEQGTTQVQRFLNQNPLGAGIIAVAAGAAIGMMLPATRIEQQTIGQARDQFVDQAESTVHQALDKVDQQTQS
jgi:hypothetical protein